MKFTPWIARVPAEPFILPNGSGVDRRYTSGVHKSPAYKIEHKDSSPGTGALQGIVDLKNGNFSRTRGVVLEKFTSPSQEIHKFHGAIDTRDEYPVAFRLFVILFTVLPRLEASLNFFLCMNNRERKTTRAAQKNTANYLDIFKNMSMLKRLGIR